MGSEEDAEDDLKELFEDGHLMCHQMNFGLTDFVKIFVMVKSGDSPRSEHPILLPFFIVLVPLGLLSS